MDRRTGPPAGYTHRSLYTCGNGTKNTCTSILSSGTQYLCPYSVFLNNFTFYEASLYYKDMFSY